MTNQFTNEAVLYLVKGGEAQYDISFPLPSDSEIILGRDSNCDILLDLYDNVSRRHAVIRPVNGQTGQWMISDLNSANGTFINGRRLEKEHILKSKDKINIAKNGPCFQFEYKQPLVIPTKNKYLPISYQRTIQEQYYELVLLPTTLTIVLKTVYINDSIANYTFDLDRKQLIIVYRKNLFQWLFGSNAPTPKEYSLSEFTGVRLDKSEYEGNRGTKTQLYIIYLQREQGEDIQIATKCRIVDSYGYSQTETGIEKLEKAQELANLIEKYLESIHH